MEAPVQARYAGRMSASKLRVYHRLQLAAHRVQKAADRALMDAAALTTAQAAVLSVVAAEGGRATQREVARQLGINESAVTAMAARLVAMGLVDRSRDEADARTWRLALSETGRGALGRIEKPFGGVNRKIEEVLDPEEVARLADYLGRIGAAFEPGS
jgi:DNA-binding MarR family transcriptional regulator